VSTCFSGCILLLILPLCIIQQNIALTTENPEECTVLDTLFNMYSYSPKRYWTLYENRIHHSNGSKVIASNMLDLRVGQSVGLLVSSGGDLHMFVDGQHREVVWSGLPTDQPLWGAADVTGKCTKIKADILYG